MHLLLSLHKGLKSSANLRFFALMICVVTTAATMLANDTSIYGDRFGWDSLLTGYIWGLICALVATTCLSLFKATVCDLKSFNHTKVPF
ncbi:MAG: hypothetical protein NC343_01575 [Muribaculum sp.]|nr:hypothetical protein [Muribaculaceae bacterium]MCM1080426.1 hypothetical protein [Muribaculum sp.]